MENAIRLGVADVIADVVETGTTLRQAGLEIVGEPILDSVGGAGPPRRAPTAHAAGGAAAAPAAGVLVARRYVMLAYDVRAEQLDAAVRADPRHRVADRLPAAPRGLGGGAGDGARATSVHRIMDELYELGARAILVTDIHACRL